MCMVIGVVGLVDHIHVFSLCTQNGTEISTLCMGLIWWNSKTKPKPKTKTKNWIKMQFDMLFIKFKWAVCSQSLQSASYIILHFLYHSLYHIIYKLNCQKSWDPPICTCCTCTCVACLFFPLQNHWSKHKPKICWGFTEPLWNQNWYLCLFIQDVERHAVSLVSKAHRTFLKTYNVHVCNFTATNI